MKPSQSNGWLTQVAWFLFWLVLVYSLSITAKALFPEFFRFTNQHGM